MMKRNHRSLQAWQLSVQLVEDIYAATREFPREELFGLTAQMRRCAISVPANIAEGAARGTTRELIRYLTIAAASLSELDTHIEIAQRLGYLRNAELHSRIDTVAAVLMGLDASLRQKLK